MINIAIALGGFLLLVVLLLLSVLSGRKYGKKQLTHSSSQQHKLEVVSVAEGAVFALLGLLIAFTFSGAYERFEARKMHIIEEANAFETAYLRVDLLTPKTRGNLRANIHEYLKNHLQIYSQIPFPHAKSMERAEELRKLIWDQAVASSNLQENIWVGQLVIPSINNMFDVVYDGYALTRNHPPAVIYLLLIGLALLGGFLVGYTTAESSTKRSIHVTSYVILTAFTIYVILDLELPRLGLIRVDSFDHVLANVGEHFRE